MICEIVLCCNSVDTEAADADADAVDAEGGTFTIRLPFVSYNLAICNWACSLAAVEYWANGIS